MMKHYFTRIFVCIFLCVLFANYLLGNSTKTAQRILYRTIAPELIQFKGSQTIPLYTLTAHAFAQFPKNHTKLNRAFGLFETTPGFQHVIASMIRHRNQWSVAGYWYEIEKALILHEMHCTYRNQAIISAFSAHITNRAQTHKREFDIVAVIDDTPHLFECKNTKWTLPIKEMGPQFCCQKAIADSHGIAYHVNSKRTIPQSWKTFFAKHEISAEYDPCDDNEPFD